MGTATLGLLKSEIILPVVPEYVPVVPLCPISRPSRPMIIGPELGPLRAAKLLLVCQVDLCWSFSELLIESFWGVPWILWPRKSQNSTIKMNMSQTILTSYFQNYTSKVKINVFGRINFFGYLGLLNWKIFKRTTVTFIKWNFFWYFDLLCDDEDLRLDAFEDFRWDWCCDLVLVQTKIPLMEMQITLANKWPVDDKYRYMTGNPTNRYKTVKSLERELTAQSWPQPGIGKNKI